MDFGPVMGGTVVGHSEGNGRGDELIRAVSGLCVRVGDRRQGVVVYDKNLCQCQGAWFGGINVTSFRYGLYTQPANDSPLGFAVPAGLSWDKHGSFDCPDRPSDFPAPRDWVDWQAVHQCGARTVVEYLVGGVRVLEHPWVEEDAGTRVISRAFEIAPRDREMWLRLMPIEDAVFRYFGPGWLCFYDGRTSQAAALVGGRRGASESGRQVTLSVHDRWVVVKVAPHAEPVTFKVLHGTHAEDGAFEALGTSSPSPDRLEPLIQGGFQNWPGEIETAVETEGTEPYVIDHILPPIDNPWRALCFFSGIDFLPDGRAALCTAYGDVWTVSGLDTPRPRWKRFAAGLNQPLGLKVVDGQVHVIERGQLTRVVDVDGDGEADALQKVNNRWHDAGEAHAFNMGLEFHDGYFYFNKSGEWGSPHGGTLLKVPADGGDAIVHFTGLRHTNGLGLTPDGRITCAGQQGNWTPASRVDLCRAGGFGGLMEAAHRDPPPLIFDEPLAWLPIDLDSSSADQVFAPSTWGPLGGQMLHLSWGQCSVIHLMTETMGDVEQAAACRLPMARTLSGCARGRFSPHDGQLYLACLNGWQCRNTWDGALERVRFVGGEYPAPVAAAPIPGGLSVTFGCDLDPSAAKDPAHYSVQQWNYWWSAHYGSPDYSPRNRNREHRDTLRVTRAALRPDGRTVEVMVDDLQPAMQTRLVYALRSAAGQTLQEAVDLSLQRVPAAFAGDRELSAGQWTETLSDIEMTLEMRPGRRGYLEIDLREGQNGAVGYRLELGD
jgi:hypothetical protein